MITSKEKVTTSIEFITSKENTNRIPLVKRVDFNNRLGEVDHYELALYCDSFDIASVLVESSR